MKLEAKKAKLLAEIEQLDKEIKSKEVLSTVALQYNLHMLTEAQMHSEFKQIADKFAVEYGQTKKRTRKADSEE
jgi:hypothetical protein